MPPPAYIVEPNTVVLINSYATAFGWLLAFFVYSRFFLENVLPRVYRRFWSTMEIGDRRSFTCHHHWLTVKGIAVPGIWPFINVMFRGKAFYDPILPNSNVTNGDFLGTLFMMITASFAWELAYRTKISPVSLLHHSAAICLAAWQLAGEVHVIPYTTIPPPEGRGFIDDLQNVQQLKLVLVYGVFEVVFESWMHFACILHKVWAGQYAKQSKLWYAGGLWVGIGSFAELAIMAVLWSSFWATWETGMKVAMIILHFAQLHGFRIGISLGRKYARKAAEERKGGNPDATEVEGDAVVTLPKSGVEQVETPMQEKNVKLEA